MTELIKVGGVGTYIVLAIAGVLVAVMTLAIADVGIGIELATAIVDVGTGIVTSKVEVIHACTHLCATIVACLTVALEHDVDDTHRAFGAILRRGVGDNLDALDALGRHLL